MMFVVIAVMGLVGGLFFVENFVGVYISFLGRILLQRCLLAVELFQMLGLQEDPSVDLGMFK